MTTDIFFQNLTNQNFELKDVDNNIFGQILAGESYSLKLNFSGTFEKQYNLIFSQQALTFWLNINGEISRVQANGQPYNMIVQFENCRAKNFNKLIIAPQGGIFLRGCSPIRQFPGSLFFDLTRIFN